MRVARREPTIVALVLCSPQDEILHLVHRLSSIKTNAPTGPTTTICEEGNGEALISMPAHFTAKRSLASHCSLVGIRRFLGSLSSSLNFSSDSDIGSEAGTVIAFVMSSGAIAVLNALRPHSVSRLPAG